ncbi:cell division cycle protein 20 homolog [Lineus longissimus]|uniref:cell division cycle protein 20 homolog n=1 Tax=Lineus longissimus TaxID=88925 RepID=UPI00315D60AD
MSASNFNFENSLNEVSKLDAPLQRGPLMRWQRKALEQGRKQSEIKCGNSRNALTPLQSTNTRTPGKSGERSAGTKKTPSKSKTPNKSQDRFIPNRATTDFSRAHFIMTNSENENPDDSTEPDYQQKLSEAMGNQNQEGSKILSFKQKAPPVPEGYHSQLKVLYSSSKSSVTKCSSLRHIPQTSERILDAPELVNDYYLNLIDWSSNNHLAVGLANLVFIWNASDSSTSQLFELEGPEEYITSVKWIKEGSFIAVGDSSGNVQLWDVGQNKKIRTMGGHASRVGSLSWNSYILSSGSRSGAIHHHDVRVAEHHVATLDHHVQEVCGLAWSPDGRHLASGGNDNVLNIWDASLGQDVTPVHTFTAHDAAVKAVAWCPWQPQLLASGGGTADRTICIWNVDTGMKVSSTNTGSQVCALLWSPIYKELMSGHGFNLNQLTIWKYPAMTKVAELMGHEDRVLGLCTSPDGTTVASAAADETIRLWKCFEPEKTTSKSKSTKNSKGSTSVLQKSLR